MNTRHHPLWQRLIAGSIWAVAILAGLFAILNPTTAAGGGAGPQVGSKAPDFILKSLDGQTVKLSELKGKAVLLNFFTTWCPTCRVEMPDLEAAWVTDKNHEFVLLAVDLDESEVTVSAFKQRYSLTFPILLDKGSRVANSYGVLPLPTTYFIDAGGIVRAKVTRQLRPEQIRAQLKSLLPGGEARG